MQSLQHDDIAGLAACTLILYAHAAAPSTVPTTARDAAQDALDALLPTAPPASLLLVARVHWLTGAPEAARALLDGPAAAGDPTARSLLAWVAVTSARQQRTTHGATVLLGFDEDSDAVHDARVLCDQALAARPADACVLVAAAHAYSLCGQHQNASIHATHALRLKPGWLPALLAACMVAIARGDWEAAVAAAGSQPPLALRLLVGTNNGVLILPPPLHGGHPAVHAVAIDGRAALCGEALAQLKHALLQDEPDTAALHQRCATCFFHFGRYV